MDYTISSILDMNNGAFKALINRDVARVIDNIMDPFTDPYAKRKVTISVSFVPTDDRRIIKVKVQSKATLAAEEGEGTSLLITGDNNGEMQLVEITGQIPGQVSAFGGVEPDSKALDLRPVRKDAK